MNIDVKDDQMQTLVAKAFLDILTQEKRDELLQNAIKSLFEKEKSDRYGYGSTSKLTALFADAARDVARDQVKAMMETDEAFIAQIRSMFAEAAEKTFVGESRAKLVEAFASSMQKALSGDRYLCARPVTPRCSPSEMT